MSHETLNIAAENSDKHEISLLRAEVSQIHREMLCALQYVAEILTELKSIEGVEAESAAQLTELIRESRSAQDGDHRRCRLCGGPLKSHRAPAGKLVVCDSCGWSEFIDRNGRESSEIRPDDVSRQVGADVWTS